MIRNQVLGRLQPFRNTVQVIEPDQDVYDIMKGILKTHNRYKEEYDKISEMFAGRSPRETAKNLWQFLKANVPYRIESTQRQTLRSPSAILALPADCKSYALFINGVLDSLNRKGILEVPVSYRYASYNDQVRDPQHVFAVMYPGTAKEIWIDPVLQAFNEHRQPAYYKDKKLPIMLLSLSGISSGSADLQRFRNALVRERDMFLAKRLISRQQAGIYDTAIRNLDLQLQGNTIGLVPVDPQAVYNLLTSIFAKHHDPNKQWEDWDRIDIRDSNGAGSSAADIILHNRTDVPPGNVISYIQANGLDVVLNNHKWGTVTPTIVNAWLTRNGYVSDSIPQNQTTAAAGTAKKNNTLLYLGAAGLGLYLLTNKKRR